MKDKKTILVFIIGLFSVFWIRLLGVISIGELIVLFFSILLFLGNGKRYLKNHRFRKLIVLLLLFLLGVVLSNLYNNAPSDDFAKGFGTVVMIMPNLFVAYWLLHDNVARIRYFVLGYLFSMLITNNLLTYFSYEQVLGYDITNLEDFFAYRYAPLMLAVVALFHYKYQKFISVAMLFFGLFFLYGGSRNLFLIYELAGILLLYIGKTTEQNKEQKLANLRKAGMRIFLVVLVGGTLAYSGYKQLAMNGSLGEVAEEKYQEQASSKYGIISGGRSEFFVGLYAAIKSPVFGYGSYAKDNGINDEFANLIGAINYQGFEVEQIKTHSHIVGFWVWNGILSLPFWIFVIGQLILYLRKNICSVPQVMAYMLVSNILLLWNILFSPFADRISFSFVLIAMVTVNSNLLKKDA